MFVKEVPAENTVKALSPPEQVELKLPTTSKFKVAGEPPKGESGLEIVLLVLHPPVEPSFVVCVNEMETVQTGVFVTVAVGVFVIEGVIVMVGVTVGVKVLVKTKVLVGIKVVVKVPVVVKVTVGVAVLVDVEMETGVVVEVRLEVEV